MFFFIDFRIERTEGRERTLTAVKGKGALCILFHNILYLLLVV